MESTIRTRIQIVKSSTSYASINLLESEGKLILELISEHKDSPNYNALRKVKDFFISVENWKYMESDFYDRHVHKNCALDIWDSLKNCIESTSDIERIESLMVLNGLGKSTDNKGRRSAKVATAILRMLFPEQWGVVDWRVASLLEVVDSASKTMELHKLQNKKKYYSKIDAIEAVKMQEKYRLFKDIRAADMEISLFDISLDYWPLAHNK